MVWAGFELVTLGHIGEHVTNAPPKLALRPKHSAYFLIIIIIKCSAQGQVFHCKLRHQGRSSAQRQVFHRKLRKQGCKFTRDE